MGYGSNNRRQVDMDYRLENADRRPSTFAYFRKSTIDSRVWRSTRIPACQWQYWDSRRANVWQFFGFKLLRCQSHVSLLWILTFMIINVVLVIKWRNFVVSARFHVNAKKLRRTKVHYFVITRPLFNDISHWLVPHFCMWHPERRLSWHQRTEWHGAAHAARPSAPFVLGWTGPRKSGPADFCSWAEAGRAATPPGRARPPDLDFRATLEVHIN